ncbi:Phosphate transporter [Corchorus olitorius]|uniref:Phosphate transporter n=1 Tax=Corchorus olitorius TaxID=93759 RepID=A0A1R3IBV9_9ROSI|nr:Phosphate transporter [Corchorus olitorius]
MTPFSCLPSARNTTSSAHTFLVRNPHLHVPKFFYNETHQLPKKENLVFSPFQVPTRPYLPLLSLKNSKLTHPFASISSFAEAEGDKEQKEGIHLEKHGEAEGKTTEEDLPGMAKAFDISSSTASAIAVFIAFAALTLPLFMKSLGLGLGLKTKILSYATLLFGFYMAWNIGANDVANAMGTSVGSGALTLRQAVLIAAILEFSGALLMGTHVTSTMQNGILVANVFKGKNTLLFAGLLSSLAAAGTWLQVASYYGWPVSTTHCIVGSMVGFGLVYGGAGAVFWSSLARVTSSWVISPVLGALVSFLVYKCIRRLGPLLVKANSSHSESQETTTHHKNLGLLSDIAGPTGTQLEIVYGVFGYMQVLSACFMSFAHGGNDVSNAIGPLAAALSILQGGASGAEIIIPNDVLAWGGFGIVAGLMMWGYRVIATIGKKITELTPTRGFAAEFAAASVVLFASKLGLPVSATHTLVGAVMGVGFARGLNSVRAETVREIVTSWAVTIPVGASLAIVYTWILTKLLSFIL